MRCLDHARIFFKRFPNIRILWLIDGAELRGRKYDPVDLVDIPFPATVINVFFKGVSKVRSLYQDRVLAKVEGVLHQFAFLPSKPAVGSSLYRMIHPQKTLEFGRGRLGRWRILRKQTKR